MSRRSKGQKYRNMFIRFLDGLRNDQNGPFTVIKMETGYNDPYQQGQEMRRTILEEGKVPFLKILFIKNLRQITDCRLLEAKRYADAVEAGDSGAMEEWARALEDAARKVRVVDKRTEALRADRARLAKRIEELEDQLAQSEAELSELRGPTTAEQQVGGVPVSELNAEQARLRTQLQAALNTPEKASGALQEGLKDVIKHIHFNRHNEAFSLLLDLLVPPAEIPF